MFFKYFFLMFLSFPLLAMALKNNSDKGKRLYLSHCISCHNKDPNLKGSLGPEIVGVPYEVFETKVLTGKYPEKLPNGYKPRRKTKLMKSHEHLKGQLKDLHEWIESMKKK